MTGKAAASDSTKLSRAWHPALGEAVKVFLMHTPIETSLKADQVAVLTVTYGDRIDMLEKMVRAVTGQGVRDVYVFCNGLAVEVRDRLDLLADRLGTELGVRFRRIHSDFNLGPGTGFAELIDQAFAARGIEAVWLLDDDNLPDSDCLDSLLAAHEQHPEAALATLRRTRPYLMAAAQNGYASAPLAGTIFGFEVRKLAALGWQRLLQRCGWLRAHQEPNSQSPGSFVALPRAPYGSILIPRKLRERAGLPKCEFVIYADDFEFTERLAREGGLYLVPNAVIDDQEPSWNMKGKRQDIMLACAEPDFRLYYSVRNAVWLDVRRCTAAAAPWFAVNTLAMITATCLQALLRGRTRNMWIVAMAMVHGMSGKLGANSKYPLPQFG